MITSSWQGRRQTSSRSASQRRIARRPCRAPHTAKRIHRPTLSKRVNHRQTPSGKSPSKDRLLSRALKAQLADRAPDNACEAAHVAKYSSWATGPGLHHRPQIEHADIAYARLLFEYCEPAPTQRLAFEAPLDEDGNPVPTEQIHVHFVESEYCKQHPEERGTMTVTPPTQMPPPLIEARLTEPTEAPAPTPPAPMPRPVQYDDPRRDPKSIWFRG